MPGRKVWQRCATGPSKLRVQIPFGMPRVSRYVMSLTSPGCGTILAIADRSIALIASMAVSHNGGGSECMWFRMSTDFGIPSSRRISENIHIWGSHNVPSRSNITPFNLGALCRLGTEGPEGHSVSVQGPPEKRLSQLLLMLTLCRLQVSLV